MSTWLPVGIFGAKTMTILYAAADSPEVTFPDKSCEGDVDKMQISQCTVILGLKLIERY